MITIKTTQTTIHATEMKKNTVVIKEIIGKKKKLAHVSKKKKTTLAEMKEDIALSADALDAGNKNLVVKIKGFIFALTNQ